MITTSDVMGHVGLASPRTLIRWQDAGLVPAPKRVRHPNGRGVIGQWPDWIFRRCDQIRELQAAGWSLDKIADQLGSDWEAEESAWRCAVALKAQANWNPSESDVKHVADKLYAPLRRLGLAMDCKDASPKALQEGLPDWIRRAFRFVAEGIAPVIVIDPRSIGVVPDFIAAKVATERQTVSDCLAILPILRELENARAKHFLPRDSNLVFVENWGIREATGH
jgi:hypothetical protein